jgi:3-deoxy-D-manno-octulosonic-acid transferase
VGEGLQAGAVLGALVEHRPGVQAAFTHFSPSAEGLGDRIGADVSAYLPWDVAESVGSVLDALDPDLLAFTKTEVWPVLVEEAVRRGIPSVIVGATVPEGAGRMRWPARAMLSPTWGCLAAACANAPEDAERLVVLGVDAAVVHVTGDPGIDSAASRLAEADPDAPYLAPFHVDERPTVVAGSTWPADEDVLVRAWARVRRDCPAALLVLAPHEPEEVRVAGLLESLRGSGLSAVTLATVERKGSVQGVDAVVVDRVGVLAHLYTVADVAYVGGGFGRNGLHSVVEPAAAGAPVLFGPRHVNARAAADLLGLGAARTVRDSDGASVAIVAWLADPDAKNGAARRSMEYIGLHVGAARRTARLLHPLIGDAGLA